jgi:ABC-type nitrate/sulfonate/bicarbonate transport system permease component
MLPIFVRTHLGVVRTAHRWRDRLAVEDGQTSAEYALVLLGAAGVALLVGVWAGQTDKIGKLFDSVFDGVIRTVKAG